MRRFWIFCVLAVMFPYVATLALRGTIKGMENSEKGELLSGRQVRLDRQGYVDVEEYLVGVVARQMPADYAEEALKAQAIIARTCVYRQMEERSEISQTELNMDYLEEGQMEKLWGKPKFLEYYQKVRQAVEETNGTVMEWEGEYIEPLFHRCSGGWTREGDQGHPYLASVDSREDLESDGYLTVVTWTAGESTERIRQMKEGESLTQEQIPDSIQVIEKDDAGYVTRIQIGSHSFDGEEVRMALGLPSAAFTLEGYEGGVRAVCRGQGHGYGMSQYGAHKKASNGMKAEEILAYYYRDIKISKLFEDNNE